MNLNDFASCVSMAIVGPIERVVFPVFVEDVRDVLRAVDFVDQGGPRHSGRNAETSSAEMRGYVPGHTYRLMPAALQHMLQLVPDDGDESAPNERRRLA